MGREGLRGAPPRQTDMGGHRGRLQFDKHAWEVEDGKSNFRRALALSMSPAPDFAAPQRAVRWWSDKAPLHSETEGCAMGRQEPESHGGPQPHYLILPANHRTLRTGLELGCTGHTPGAGTGMSGKERGCAKASSCHARQTSQ